MWSFSLALILWWVRAEGKRRLRPVVGERTRRVAATAAYARSQLIRLCRARVRPEKELYYNKVSKSTEKNVFKQTSQYDSNNLFNINLFVAFILSPCHCCCALTLSPLGYFDNNILFILILFRVKLVEDMPFSIYRIQSTRIFKQKAAAIFCSYCLAN